MDTALAIIGSGALAAAISGIFGLLTIRQKKRTGVAAGVRCVLYDRIKYLARCYINAEEVAAEDLEDIIEMHRIYHDELGGNGYLDSLLSTVKKLRITK